MNLQMMNNRSIVNFYLCDLGYGLLIMLLWLCVVRVNAEAFIAALWL